MITRYNLMKDSATPDIEDGELYPDPLSLNYSGFETTQPITSIILAESDILNLNRTLASIYGTADLIDVVLSLNEVGHANLLRPGDKLYLPSLEDIMASIGNI